MRFPEKRSCGKLAQSDSLAQASPFPVTRPEELIFLPISPRRDSFMFAGLGAGISRSRLATGQFDYKFGQEPSGSQP